MSSYSEWVSARRIEYAEAITEAYNNRDGTPTVGTYAWAWSQMIADSDISGILPPGSVAFLEPNPTGEEDEILLFGKFLTDNPSVAAALNLAVQVIVDTGAQTDLDTTTVVGGEYRQWKGQKVYTFPNGIIVGKDSKLIASFGAQVSSISDSIGDDCLIFFDGIPGSKGTTTQGTVVFNGDMVVSGSIQGAGGIVVIDDVIQLETGVNNPAGIAVDDQGKILLRHRGLGFLDFVDEDERMKDLAVDEGKVWVGTQNTNSSRWGTTLIPNGNFSLVTAVSENGSVVEYPSGAVTIGSTSREVSFLTNGNVIDYGVVSFDASGGTGFIMPAVPIESERYIVTIRIASSATNIDASALDPIFGAAYGAYFFFNETSDEELDGVEHIHHLNSSITGTNTIQSNVSVHSTNTEENRINVISGAPDAGLGSSLNTTWNTLTFTYEPTKVTNGFETKYASFGVYIKNVSEDVYVDYVVMTAKPPLASEIADDIAAVETGITNETGSLVPDAAFPTINLWTKWPTTNHTLSLDATGGDGSPTTPDSAAQITMDSTINGAYAGLLSSAIQRDHDKYLVGARIQSDIPATVEIWVIEETDGLFNAFSSQHYVAPSGSNEVSVTTVSGTGALDDPSVGSVSQSIPASTWTNMYGTYIPTGLDVSSHDSSSQPTTTVGRFSILINVKTPDAAVLVDYVWCSKQTASGDLAQALADYAYGTAEKFVTDMNEQLTKESGSLITNASMAMLNADGKPAGYAIHNGTLSLDQIGDRAIQFPSGSRLYTPPFAIDPNGSDKFSIGLRMKKANTSNTTVYVNVIYSTTDIQNGQSTVVHSTYPPSTGTYLTTSTSTELLIDPNNFEQGATGNEKDWLLNSTSWESILATWDKPAGAKVASIMIYNSGADALLDYVLVKEQTCSFELAESTAVTKRDEAIAQATGALQGFTNSLNQEQGSLLANSTFASYVYDSTSGTQHPKNWAVTRSSGTFKRIVTSTEAITDSNGDYIPVPGESVISLGLMGGGGLLEHSGTSTVGLLSSYFSIPSTIGVGDFTTSDDTTLSPTGRYMVAIQLKSTKTSHVSGMRILVHESKTIPKLSGTSTPHILVTNSSEADFDSGTTVASSFSTGYTGQTLDNDDVEVKTQKIQLINLSDPSDDIVGTDSDNDGTSDDLYIEQWTDTNSFHSIGGTYTPSSGMRYVCFEFIFETNKSNQSYAIDYITLTPQTVDADFADTLAQARAEDAIDTLESEPPQTGQLLANPFFTSGAKRRIGGYPKKWIPYGSNPDFDILSFTNDTLKRGLTLSGADSPNAGVFSMPFRTSSDDYEIKVRVKRDAADNAELIVRVYEYDSDIEPDIEAIVSSAANIPSSKSSSVVVANVGSGYKALQTIDNNDSSPALSDSFETYSFDYVPSDTCRYASVLVRFQYIDSDKSVVISSVTCTVDTTASGNRLFGPFRGATANGVFNTGYTGRNNTISVLTKRALVSFGTSTASEPNPEYFHLSQEWRFKSTSAYTYTLGTPFGNVNYNIPDVLSFQNNQGSQIASWTSVGYLNGDGTNTLINFTGQHRCDSQDFNPRESIGLIVVSTGKYNNLIELDRPTINESLPVVTLSSRRNQKSSFGVLSDEEDRNGGPREYSHGNFVSVFHDEEKINRSIVNSLGEGAVWVCDINGNLENGDYITTCEIPGHGMRQDDDLLHNYTVAKITQDCTFELNNPYYDCVEFEFEGNTYRKAFVGCTYHCG